jgi:N-acetylglucosamine-6-phosphate deacetylase
LTQHSIYTASRIFTGDAWLTDHAVVIADGIIREVLPAAALPDEYKRQNFPGGILAPAFIDAQIYGAYGKLFSVYPQEDSLTKLVEYCKKGGASCCLPTVATNKKEVIYKCIHAIKDYWTKGGEGVLGLHVEGPWINPKKRGAHLQAFIHSPTLAEVEELLNYGKGVIRMITLAPEVCSKEVIDLVRSYPIIISAGHSNATYAEAMKGFDNGITAVTHLFNAMSGLHHREPGLVGAAMNTDKAMTSIVPDGHHVDYAAIRIAKQIMKERLFAITDAVTETKEGPYQHCLVGDKYESAGILSGSALTMQKALYNLVHQAGIDLEESLRMCSLYPAKLLGLEQERGRIKADFKASMVLLDDGLQVVTLIQH